MKSLIALKKEHPTISRLIVVSAITQGEWFFQVLSFECPACEQGMVVIQLVVNEADALDAIVLWPEAEVDRNAVFEWRE